MLIFPASRYPVSFWQGARRLHGDLLIPPGPGPYPGLVLAGPVSSPRDRGQWVEELAQSGLATLSWDSPGWGESSGAGRWQPPDQRALEVLAGVEFLANSGQSPCDGIALLGSGLGGWAAVLAAGLSSRVDAVVLLSPPGLDPVGAELDRLGNRLRALGFISAEVGLAQAVLRERARRLATGQSGADVLAGEAACRQAPWYPYLPGGTPEELEGFAGLARLDLRAMLAGVRCPVLAVFDGQQPAGWQRGEEVRQAVAARRYGEHEVVVLPGWNGADGQPGWALRAAGPQRLVGPADLVGLVVGWVNARVGARSRYPVRT